MKKNKLALPVWRDGIGRRVGFKNQLETTSAGSSPVACIKAKNYKVIVYNQA